MKVQAFIANWNSPTTDAELVKSTLSPLCETQILSAYDVPFMYQWKEMLDKFNGDIMLWVMADVRLSNAAETFPRMVRLLSCPDIGIYAPHTNYSSQQSDIARCKEVEPDIYEVAANDLNNVALSSKMLNLLPSVNPVENPRAWCYDYLMASYAQRNGLKVVRDYRFTSFHPEGSIYNIEETIKKTNEWKMSLPPQDAEGVSSVMKRAYLELCGPPKDATDEIHLKRVSEGLLRVK